MKLKIISSNNHQTRVIYSWTNSKGDLFTLKEEPEYKGKKYTPEYKFGYIHQAKAEDGEEYSLLWPKKIDSNTDIIVDGEIIELIGSNDLKNTKIDVVDKLIFPNKLDMIKRDYSRLNVKKISCIDDLSLVWDYQNDSPLYSLDEMKTILIYLLVAEEGLPSALLITGGSRTLKTTILKLLSKVFSEQVFAGTTSRGRALVPSFYNRQPQIGYLGGNGFVALCNEFLKFAVNNRPNVGYSVAIEDVLNNIMEILEHSPQTVNSGKASISFCMKESLIAVENKLLMNKLPLVYANDDAPLHRWTFLVLDRGTERRILKLKNISPARAWNLFKKRLEERDFSVQDYCDLFYYLRENLSRVEFDEDKLENIINQLGNDFNFPISEKATVILKGITMLNSVLKCHNGLPKSFVASDEDYKESVDLLIKLCKQFQQVVTVGVDAPIESNEFMVKNEVVK